MERNQIHCSEDKMDNNGRCPPVIELLKSPPPAPSDIGHIIRMEDGNAAVIDIVESQLNTNNKRANTNNSFLMRKECCSPFFNCDDEWSDIDDHNKPSYTGNSAKRILTDTFTDQWLFDEDLEDCQENLLLPISSKCVKLNDDNVMCMLTSPKLISANSNSSQFMEQNGFDRNEMENKPITYQTGRHDDERYGSEASLISIWIKKYIFWGETIEWETKMIFFSHTQQYGAHN